MGRAATTAERKDVDGRGDVACWTAAAKALPAAEVRKPSRGLGEFVRELEGASAFVAYYWAPADDRPGLELEATQLGDALADELASLARAVLQLDGEARLYVRSAPRALRQRADALLAELVAVVSHGVRTSGEARLERALAGARKRLGRARTVAQVTQGLVDFAVIGGELGAALGALGCPPAQLETARQLAEALAQPPHQQRRQEALALRNRIMTLGRQRLATLRTAVGFVFREHPDIVRAASARWLRR